MNKLVPEIKQIENRMDENRERIAYHAEQIQTKFESNTHLATLLASGFVFGLCFALRKKSTPAALLALGISSAKVMRIVSAFSSRR